MSNSAYNEIIRSEILRNELQNNRNILQTVIGNIDNTIRTFNQTLRYNRNYGRLRQTRIPVYNSNITTNLSDFNDILRNFTDLNSVINSTNRED